MNPKPYLKYILKMKIVSPLRSLFLSLAGARANQDGWNDRLLIINLQALGDLVVFTSVLKHYKKRFPGKKIYLLTKRVGIEEIFEGEFVDSVITMDYSRFAVDPFYGAKLINQLRRIGFHTVVSQDFSAAEIMGRIISVNLSAEEVIGYEGLGIEFVRPFDSQQVRNLRIVMDRFFPRFTRIIPSIDAARGYARRIPSAIHHYRTIYEAVVGAREDDYSLEFPARTFDGAEDTLAKFDLEAGKYAVLNVNASMPFKRWPLERFREVAHELRARGLTVALVGSRGEMPLVAEFVAMVGKTPAEPEFVNLAGRTNIAELIHVVRHARIVVTNDTSLVHFAVAAKTPLVAVAGGGWFGMFTDYGYPDIHRWATKERFCFGDNWACERETPGRTIPCLLGVETATVVEQVNDLLDYVEKHSGKIPLQTFDNGYLPEPAAFDPHARRKIIYAGLQAENYNPARFPSFERVKFFGTLAGMDDVSVIEFPFDPIVGMGKRWWNRKLIELVRREKPDLVFVFMLSDEFEPTTLDTIRMFVKSIVWFADDQWRLDNYSRHWAPHFTKAVTTWSKAPAIYERYGVGNIIRSQWGANPTHPHAAHQDIDVSFIGQRTAARERIIAELKREGIDVHARGFGWPGGKLSEGEVGETIARSKINLNLNTPLARFSPRALGRILVRRSRNRLVLNLRLADNLKCWWRTGTPQIKARPFEILAENAFLISPHADDMERYYDDGKEIVYYDGSTRDLAKKIKYYLGREDDRRRIAAAGQARTLQEHTYEERFQNLFSLLD